jgi:hypothetical protein
MSRSTTTAPPSTAAFVAPASVADADRLACEVADLLGRMTLAERLRAYRSRVFSPRELAIAAARLPEAMPILNGELEWIAFDLE